MTLNIIFFFSVIEKLRKYYLMLLMRDITVGEWTEFGTKRKKTQFCMF